MADLHFPMVRQVICVLIAICLTDLSSSADDLILVRDGRPAAVIVIPGNRHWDTQSWQIMTEQHASRCLQANLLQMSGARLPIYADTQLGDLKVVDGLVIAESSRVDSPGAFIFVGESDLTRALGVVTSDLQMGGLHLRSFPNALVLVGHPELSHPMSDGGGLRAAVVQLLELLGCRYLWPGEVGKVVPTRRTITLPTTAVTYNPPLNQRSIRWAAVHPRSVEGVNALGLDGERWKQDIANAMLSRAHTLVEPARYQSSADISWLIWHGVGGDAGIFGGHSFSNAWEKWGEEHPDWFALQADGTRDQTGTGSRERLCVSNTGLIDAIAADVIRQAAEKPEQKAFSLCTNDGGYSSFCLCEDCAKLDAPDAPMVRLLIFKKAGRGERYAKEHVALTDRYVWFWNQIAQRVARQRPGLLLVIEAYSAFSTGPRRERLHPNLVLRYVPNDIDEWEIWRNAGAKRMYWRPNILHLGKKQGKLLVYARSMTESMNQLVVDGMLAVDVDSITGSWSTLGINYYVMARSTWNPRLTYEQILSDFAHHGFSPAAEPIRQYFVRAEAHFHNRPSGEAAINAIAALRGFLSEADRLANGYPAILKRIAFLRLGLNYTDVRTRIEYLVSQAEAGEVYDNQQAGRLLDLHYLMLRDFALYHPIAIDAGMVTRYSVNFRAWRAIGADRRRPSEQLMQRAAAAPRQTGRENSIDELMTVFGLDGSELPVPRQRANDPTEFIMEADERGNVLELPTP